MLHETDEEGLLVPLMVEPADGGGRDSQGTNPCFFSLPQGCSKSSGSHRDIDPCSSPWCSGRLYKL
jgi:hypothetical protein